MNNKKMKIAAISTMSVFAGLGVGLGIGLSFVNKIAIPLSQKMSNSIFISTFIENIGNKNFISFSDFDKSIKLYNGDEEITDYSNITINEAFINDFFKFEVPSKVKFYTERHGIDVFMKKYNENSVNQNNSIYPSYYNSSTPEFKIWFGKGEGENRVEDFITIYGAGFYDFKKTQEELDVKSMINLFGESISLKPQFYSDFAKKTLKASSFAKTISISDVISSLNSKELNGVNWNVTSVSQDAQTPSKLIINVDFSKGKLNQNYYSQTYQKFEINGFPIEMGVDDYQSKVKNFIKDEKNIIGLGEAFEYTKPTTPITTKTGEPKIGTILENYQKNAFTFDLPFSFKNRATNAGVEYIFKPWVSDLESNSVFPDEENSEIPKFKIYVRSGSGTPFQYEEYFVVRGNGQVVNTPFDKTVNNIEMEKIRELSNSGTDDPFKDKIALELIKEFASFNLMRNKITAKIIASVENPLDNIKLTLGAITWPPTVVLPTGETLKVEAKEVSSKQDKLSIKIQISIGTEFKDKASFIKEVLYDGFITEIEYDKELIKRFKDKINLDLTTSTTIKNKVSISQGNVEALKSSINSGNGAFYFFEDVFVGFDEIMNDFKWSNKPTFKIDFSGTLIPDASESIKFKIIISGGVETDIIFIDKEIKSFFVV